MKRRHFLGGMGTLGAMSLFPRLGLSENSVARNFIVVHAKGGWDTTTLFDAKPDSPYVDTPVGDWSAFGNGALWLDAGRPAVGAFFDSWGERICIINGLNVPSVAHGSCTTRVLSGYRDSKKPDITAIIGHEIGSDKPMPYLDISGSGRAGPLGADMGFVGDNNQLAGLVRRRNAPKPIDRDSWARYYPEEDEYDLIQAYVTERATQNASRGTLGENKRRYDAFFSGLDRSHQLRDFDDYFSDLGNRSTTFEDQVAMGIGAISAGLSSTLLLELSPDFDTHSNNDEQIQLFDEAFTELDVLIGSLLATPGTSESSLLEETIVLVVSEMGRTPVLNTNAGKDHWPFTSCMIIGAGISGNTIIGGTDETLAALPLDLITGEPNETGTLLEPQHLHAGILELLGVSIDTWFPNIEPLRAFHV